MDFYAGEAVRKIKTDEDYNLFEAKVTGMGISKMSDLYDYLTLKKLHRGIKWDNNYSSEIVYKESILWKEIISMPIF